MRFEILGPIRAHRDEQPVAITAGRERALLAMLLLHANDTVLTARLIEAIWPANPPRDPRNQLQRCVHQLRRRLADPAGEVIATDPAGYRATVGPHQLDLLRFRQLIAEARGIASGGRPDQAVTTYRAALGLWRGPVLADIDSHPVRQAAAVVDEEHSQALEERLHAELAAGGAGELVAELTDWVRRYPYREGLHHVLMLALYRAGRQADALAAYRHARQLLHDELGTEPGSGLQRLHQAILARDPALDAPPPAAATTATPRPPTPRELPADVAGFTGRDHELGVLDELLPDGPDPAGPVVISAIAGTAGVGKTALAVHWAHRVAARFPDGQVYVNLRGYATGAPLRPVEALSTLLRSLGMPPEQVPAEEAEASARYRSLLAGRRVLVVLDNARSVNQVRPLLPGSPGCLALVTSRDRLAGLVARDGARRVTLDVLTADEAYALLGKLLDPERIRAEPRAAADLAKACAYLPITLRIAAAILDEHPHRGIATLAAELAGGHRLGTLEVPGDEETAVRATLDLSYRTVPEPAQRMFRLLGLVPGPDVTVPAAAALAGLPAADAQRLLERLAGAHLVHEHASGRFTFHDLLREYARDRAEHEDSDDDRASALTRILGWYVSTTYAASRLIRPDWTRLSLPSDQPLPAPAPITDHPEALALMEAERANLVAAVQHAAEHAPKRYAWLLADGMRPYLRLRMGFDGLAVGRASVAAAEAEGGPREQAAAHILLSDASMLLGDYQYALEHYTHAAHLADRAGWLEARATAENNLAFVHIEAGRLRSAITHINQALAINQRLGRLSSQASNLGNLGYVLCELGELQEARQRWERAWTMLREAGSLHGEALGNANLGKIYWLLGQLDRAVEHLQVALRQHRETGDHGGNVYALRILAAVLCDAGRPAEAIHHAEAAASLARHGGDHAEDSFSLNALGASRRGLGRPAEAARCHELALEVGRRQQYATAEALVGLAGCRHDLGRHEQAYDTALSAREVAGEAGFRVLEGQALAALAAIRHSQGEPGQAEEHANRALACHRETGHRLGEARALALLGRIRRAAGDPDTARQHWRRARDLFTDIGAPVPGDVTEGLRQA